MLEGKCLECGACYHGKGLISSSQNWLCFKCGSTLEIRDESGTICSGFPPFKAKEYKVGSDPDYMDNLLDKNLLFYLVLN